MTSQFRIRCIVDAKISTEDDASDHVMQIVALIREALIKHEYNVPVCEAASCELIESAPTEVRATKFRYKTRE